MSAPRVLIPIAEGSEEMEVVILVDILRRGGCEVVCASASPSDTEPELSVTCSRGVRLLADCGLIGLAMSDFDALVIPGGGPGSERLAANATVLEMVREAVAANKLVGAVCAGPTVLMAAGVLDGRRFTCHPGVKTQLPDAMNSRIVDDSGVITSQGPGTCMEFSLAIVACLRGKSVADEIRAPLLIDIPN